LAEQIVFTWCRLGKASTGAHRRVEGRIGQQAKAADFDARARSADQDDLAAVVGDAFRCFVMPARRRRSGFQAIAGFEDP
jgi:hypothetical protein